MTPGTRNMRKAALKQSDSSSPETGFRSSNPPPTMRQKRADATSSHNAERAALAKKRFTLQGLSNRRSLPQEPQVKEVDVTRRFSLASSISASATRRTKGSLSGNLKSKRHEIKSDPTPLGYEDTLKGTMAAESKRNSAVDSNSRVPRSTSQTGWNHRCLPSMDTEDFETILSSAEELSNSSEPEEESHNKNGDHDQFPVQLTYDEKRAPDLSMESGDLEHFLEEAENGHW